MFFDDPDKLVGLMRAAAGGEIEISWDYEGESFRIYVADGKGFIRALEEMDPAQVIKGWDHPKAETRLAVSLLLNLKGIAQDWAGYVEEDGTLEILAD